MWRTIKSLDSMPKSGQTNKITPQEDWKMQKVSWSRSLTQYLSSPRPVMYFCKDIRSFIISWMYYFLMLLNLPSSQFLVNFNQFPFMSSLPLSSVFVYVSLCLVVCLDSGFLSLWFCFLSFFDNLLSCMHCVKFCSVSLI